MKKPAPTPAEPAPPPPAPVPPAKQEGMGERWLSMKQLLEKLGVSRASIYEWITDRQFPEPVQVTDRMVRWRMSDVDAWMSQRPTSAKIGSRRRVGRAARA